LQRSAAVRTLGSNELFQRSRDDRRNSPVARAARPPINIPKENGGVTALKSNLLIAL
jgi:hypothetical protein